jgi:hypothetical protein
MARHFHIEAVTDEYQTTPWELTDTIRLDSP